MPAIVAGVGEDDCGVIRLGRTLLVVSVDFVNATPIAEQLGLGAERVIGRLAVAATLADLLGSGADPRALMVAVTAPHGYPESCFKELMLGTRLEARRWNVPIVAGDTKLGKGRAVLTCGVGTSESDRHLFLANRAKVGDAIFASGYLGTCAAATYIASRSRASKSVPKWARLAITVPQLPVDRSRALRRLAVANGGIDISDGLAADLRRMCAASHVGAVLDADAIPIHPRIHSVARLAGVAPWTFSLASGGDFQFIVTVPFRKSRSVENLGFKKIGEVTSGGQVLLKHGRGTALTRLPKVGHRDRSGQTFAQEIRQIISEASRE